MIFVFVSRYGASSWYRATRKQLVFSFGVWQKQNLNAAGRGVSPAFEFVRCDPLHAMQRGREANSPSLWYLAAGAWNFATLCSISSALSDIG
jgi:hypothetical protein